MAGFIKLAAKISPKGDIFLDKVALRNFYNSTAAGVKGSDIDIKVIIHPVVKPEPLLLNIDSQSGNSSAEAIAKKQNTDKEAIAKLLSSRNSIRNNSFSKNLLKILNG